jgi:hypothetical protein
MLDINCWVLGDDPKRVFSVEIAKTKTVDALKDAIKEKKKHTFDGIDADRLDLWKVSNLIQHTDNDESISLKVDIDLTTNSDLLNSIKEEDNIRDAIELKPWSRLSKLFAGGADDEHLHIIVQRPARRYLPTSIRNTQLTRHNPSVSARYRQSKTRS